MDRKSRVFTLCICIQEKVFPENADKCIDKASMHHSLAYPPKLNTQELLEDDRQHQFLTVAYDSHQTEADAHNHQMLDCALALLECLCNQMKMGMRCSLFGDSYSRTNAKKKKEKTCVNKSVSQLESKNRWTTRRPSHIETIFSLSSCCYFQGSKQGICQENANL